MNNLFVRQLGVQPYEPVWKAMSDFTDNRDESTVDELWLVQHEPVYTQGQAGKPEHLLNPDDIPVVQSDRGGQVTYHGPGQLVAYPLINLRRRKLGVRDMVSLLENTAIELLSSCKISSYAKADAPGVYVQANGQEVKVASLGLRVRKGCSFHGLSINVDMDLSPFNNINPCGYAGLPMAQIKDLQSGSSIDYDSIEETVTQLIANKLNVSNIEYKNTLPTTSLLPTSTLK
jgi:lipoyl(octanoyl) transferase